MSAPAVVFTLPAATNLEQLVLGSLMLDADSVIESLAADDFSLQKHRLIFAAARRLRDQGEPIDRVTVAQELQRTNQLEAVDGLSYLVELDSDLPKIYAIDSYVRRVRELATLRRAIQRAQILIDECMSPAADIESVARAAEFLEALNGEARRRENQPMRIGEYLERNGGLDAFLNPPRAEGIVPSPWESLNSLLLGGGFQPGQLVIIAARPSMGKSACAAQIGVHAAFAGRYTDVFSFEMSNGEIWRRMVAHVGQMSLGRIGHGTLSIVERYEATVAVTKINDAPLYIDDTTGSTVAAIERTVRKQRSQQIPVGCAIVDYLQLMEAGRKREKRQEELAEITRRFKLAGRSLKMPFLVLSQLNRDSDKEKRPPELRDLAESGSIERDADIVIFLWRDPRETEAAIRDRRPGWIDLIVAKQRNGPLGRVRTMFDPRLMTLSDSREGT